MLTLSESRQFGPISVFRDFSLSGAQVQFSNVFYVLPAAPRFATEEGDPAFNFILYQSDVVDRSKAGGVVTMSVEMAPTEEERRSIVESITASFGTASDKVELQAVPFKSGSVELVYAGDAASGEFTNRLFGNGPALLTSYERATFLLDLNADGASLLWQALDRKADLFHLKYDLVFDHRLTGVHMRVWCDAKRSIEAADRWVRAGGTDPAKLGASLTEEKTAGVEIISTTPLPAEQSAALQKSGDDLLARALASTMFLPPEPNKKSSALKLKPYSEQMEGTLNFSLDESYPLEQHAVLDTILRLDLTPEQKERRLHRIDLSKSFFNVLDVQLACTVDFKQELITDIRVRIDYDATGEGGRVQRTGEYLFKEGAATVQHFRTDLAAPDKKSYSYSVEIFYRGDTVPLKQEFAGAQAGAIILDFDAVGILDVAVEVRDVPFELVSGAAVDLEYPSKGLTQKLVLDGTHMGGSWTAVIREERQSWRYKVEWLLVDGRRLGGDWITTTARLVHLDAPEGLRSRMRVQVIASGDFSDLSQIVVDLRSHADPEIRSTLSFTASGEAHLWEAPGVQTRLEYEYRRTYVYKNGQVLTRDMDWVSGNRPVLVVADDARFHVQLIPRFLDLGGALKLVMVDLESEAEAPASAEKATVVFKNKTEQRTWSFGLQGASRHSYRYRLRAFLAQGGQAPGADWQESDADILVLQLPSH